ncbi:hypothetical protein GCM10022419_024290 [Nonomuraea rosea]|uniref:Uncharacterized protein n=1 Tax=Nonomuraea rosea TaxID=638574 RepID=A0ABP6W209_9ACTN
MDLDSQSARSAEPRLLSRLVRPLLASGWSKVDLWEDEGDEDDASLYMERSGFYLSVNRSAALGGLVVDDGTDLFEWGESFLPPLSPVDVPLVIELPTDAPSFRQAELARQAFAAAGLLDATRLLVPPQHDALRTDLMPLLHDPVYDAIRSHQGSDSAGPALERLGQDFNWRIAQAMRAWPMVVPASIPSAAARGIAEWCWRRESDVEDWHFKIDDLTMARANISATRAVLPHVHQEGIDWTAVRLALTAPERHLADGRALSQLFAEGWQPILTSIHREVDIWEQADEELGPQAVLQLLTLHGSRTESVGEWWGSGWYETAIRRAIPRATAENSLPESVHNIFNNAKSFADIISHGPDLLSDDVLLWTIKAVHAETRYPWQDGPTAPFAVTLPTWAAEELAELLTDSGSQDEGAGGDNVLSLGTQHLGES